MSATIRIGTATCGLAAGAEAVYGAIEAYVQRRQLPVTIQRTGCVGACHREPLVEVLTDGQTTLYGPVTPARDADPGSAFWRRRSRYRRRLDREPPR